MLNRFVCFMKKHIRTVYITSIILIVIITFQNINIITPLAATATITATSYPTNLNELSLNGSLIKLVILGSGSNFKATIIASDFVLNNAPIGLSISNVWLSNTDAFLQLSYNGTIFNNVITNLTVTALPSSNNKSETITSNNLTISPAIPLEGYLNYYANGQSYPANVSISGYNIKNNKLYLNIDLITTRTVSINQKVIFYYYIDIFNGNGISLGSSGSYSSPNSITGALSQNIAAVINKQITLNSALTAAYRITVVITGVSIN